LRCVLDTNVLVSALLVPGSKLRQALDRAFTGEAAYAPSPSQQELEDREERKSLQRFGAKRQK
jgi:predicted nucleic acid-binding protein